MLCWDSETVLSRELNVNQLTDPPLQSDERSRMLFHKTGCVPGISFVTEGLQKKMPELSSLSSRPSNEAFIQTDISVISEDEPTLPGPNYLHAANSQAVKLHYLLQSHTSPKTTYCV